MSLGSSNGIIEECTACPHLELTGEISHVVCLGGFMGPFYLNTVLQVRLGFRNYGWKKGAQRGRRKGPYLNDFRFTRLGWTHT